MADDSNTQDETAKHPGGRPLAYGTVGELDQAVRQYFDMCDPHVELKVTDGGINSKGETIWIKREVMTEQQPYTMSGLARHLGIDRRTLLNYSKIEQFFPTIQAARERVHEYAESQLYGRAATGAAFSLKNNFDWRDRSEIDHTSKDQPIPLLAGLASAGTLTIEDEVNDGPAQADDSTDEDQPA